MIYIERKITIKKNQAKIEQPIVLYKGDMNIELKFSIENNPFKHKSGTEATKGQLIIKRPKGEPIFSEPVKMSESKVIFIVTGDMIDGLDVDGNYTDETGAYDFQIQLLNEGESSIGSLPPVTGGIIIKEPLCERATVNATYVNKDNAYVMPANIATFSLRDSDDIFDEDGNYNKSMWVSGDIITDARLNRVEDALYEINDNIPTDYATREYVGDMIEANNDSIDNIYMKQAYMNNYASKEYVSKEIDNIGLSDYATREYVNDAISSNNANIEEYVDDAIANIEIPEAEVDLTDYATIAYVDSKASHYVKLSYLNEQDYASKKYVDEAVANIEVSGGGNVDLTDYATKEYVDKEIENISNNLTLDDVENLTVSGKVVADKVSVKDITSDNINATEAIAAPMIIAGSESEDGVAILMHDQGVGIKPAYKWDNEKGVVFYCEEENYYATKGYVNNAIAAGGGGGGIITIGSFAESSYVLDGKEFTKEIWQCDGGMAMHLVKSFGIRIPYYDIVKEANDYAYIMGLCMIIYVADPENGDAAIIIDYRSTKQYTFMVDTVEGTMTLVESYYAWENPEFVPEEPGEPGLPPIEGGDDTEKPGEPEMPPIDTEEPGKPEEDPDYINSGNPYIVATYNYSDSDIMRGEQLGNWQGSFDGVTWFNITEDNHSMQGNESIYIRPRYRDVEEIALYRLFENVDSLENVDFVNFSNSRIYPYIDYMFSNCGSLAYVDLTSLGANDRELMQNMEGMFRNCHSLEALCLDGWWLEEETNTNRMLEGCNRLIHLFLVGCSTTTIEAIINGIGFPTGSIDEEVRTIYCNEKDRGDLEAPENWKFSYEG